MQINPSALIEQYHRSIGSRLTSASLTKEFGVNNSNNVPNYLPLHHRERRKRLEDAINAGTMGFVVEALSPAGPNAHISHHPHTLPDINAPIDDCGNTLLHLAISHLDYNLVCALLLKGAQPNAVNTSGIKPLRLARLLFADAIVAVLLEHGAKEDDLVPNASRIAVGEDATASSNSNNSNAVLLKTNNRPHLVPLLSSSVAQQQSVSDYHSLVSKGYRTPTSTNAITAMSPMISSPQSSSSQSSPSHIRTSVNVGDAAYVGWQGLVPLFEGQLKHQTTQIALQTTDAYNATPLMKAAYKGHVKLVEWMIASGASVEPLDNNGYDAIIWACFGGSEPCARLVLAAALGHCQQTQQDFRVEWVCRVYANSNNSSNTCTPLIAACVGGSLQIVECLLGLGAEVEQTVRGGVNALMVASWMGWRPIVKRLLTAGARAPQIPFDRWLFHGIQMQCGDNTNDSSSNSNTPILPNGKVAQSVAEEFIQTIQPAAAIQLTAPAVKLKKEQQLKQMWGGQLTARHAVITSNYPQLAAKVEKRIQQLMNIRKLKRERSQPILQLLSLVSIKGTLLDLMHMRLIRTVCQLGHAAETNMKAECVAVSVRAVQEIGDIIRMIEGFLDRHLTSAKPQNNTDTSTSALFAGSPLVVEIRRMLRQLNDDVRQLMLNTRISVGAWPPPDAQQRIVADGCRMCRTGKRAVMLANCLGHWPIGPIDINQLAIEGDKFDAIELPTTDVTVSANNSNMNSNNTNTNGGEQQLSFAVYQKQKEAKILEKIAQTIPQQQQQSTQSEESQQQQQSQEQSQDNSSNTLVEDKADAQFFQSIQSAVRLFVQAVQTLQKSQQSESKEDYMTNASAIYSRVDAIAVELRSYYLFKKDTSISTNLNNSTTSDDGNNSDALLNGLLQEQRKITEELMRLANDVILKAKLASGVWPPENAAEEMLKSTGPLALQLKKLVTYSQHSARQLRMVQTERRRKQEAFMAEWDRGTQARNLFDQLEKMQLQALQSTSGADDSNTAMNSFDLSAEDLKLIEDEGEGLLVEIREGQQFIKGGRLFKLVEKLADQNPPIVEYRSAFMLTYRSFTTDMELLELLIKRYNITPPFDLDQRTFGIYVNKKIIPIRLRVCNIIKYWARNYPKDFAGSPVLKECCLKFIKTQVAGNFHQIAQSLLPIIDSIQPSGSNDRKQKAISVSSSVMSKLGQTDVSKEELTETQLQQAPKSILPKPQDLIKLKSNRRAFLDIDPLEFARQLCLMDFESYRSIGSTEFLDQGWEKPDSLKRSPTITRMIKDTNNLTMWVASTIVEAEDIKMRVGLIKYYVSIAMSCRDLKNFNSMTALIAGLSMGPVYRMTRTWTMFRDKNAKMAEAFDEISEIVSAKGQYSNYRKTLKSTEPPLVPFLGVFLTDLTFVELGNPDFIPDNNYINFSKRYKVASIISDAKSYQQTPFILRRVPAIVDFIASLAVRQWKSDKALFEQSFLSEPREQSASDDEEEDEQEDNNIE